MPGPETVLDDTWRQHLTSLPRRDLPDAFTEVDVDPTILDAWITTLIADRGPDAIRDEMMGQLRWLQDLLDDIWPQHQTHLPPLPVKDAIGWLVAISSDETPERTQTLLTAWHAALADHTGWRYHRAGLTPVEYDQLAAAGELPDERQLALLTELRAAHPQ